MTPQPDRQQRIDAIQDAAQVRSALGQAALHERLPDGNHQITFRGQRFVGETLQDAVEAARAGRESQL